MQSRKNSFNHSGMSDLAFQPEYTFGMAGLFDDLPALLSHLRKRAGETLAQVESATGISLASVQAYEKGATAPPLPRLELLLAHFRVEDFLALQLAVDELKKRPSRAVASVSPEELERIKQSRDLALDKLREYERISGEQK